MGTTAKVLTNTETKAERRQRLLAEAQIVLDLEKAAKEKEAQEAVKPLIKVEPLVFPDKAELRDKQLIEKGFIAPPPASPPVDEKKAQQVEEPVVYFAKKPFKLIVEGQVVHYEDGQRITNKLEIAMLLKNNCEIAPVTDATWIRCPECSHDFTLKE